MNGARVMRPCWGVCDGGGFIWEDAPQLHYIRQGSSRGGSETAPGAERKPINALYDPSRRSSTGTTGENASAVSRQPGLSIKGSVIIFGTKFCVFFPDRGSNDEQRLLFGWTPALHQHPKQLAGDGPGHKLHVRSSVSVTPFILPYKALLLFCHTVVLFFFNKYNIQIN